MTTHYRDFDDEELALAYYCVNYIREMFIDDAADDPQADHSVEVPLLTKLLEKFSP
jgi:hypothetical protein